MSEKRFENVRIFQRIDVVDNWETVNPKPGLGEICISVEEPVDEATGESLGRVFKMKIGDGAHEWKDLPYIYYTIPEIESLMVHDGANAAKVSFKNTENFGTIKNVAAALIELSVRISNLSQQIEESRPTAFLVQYTYDPSWAPEKFRNLSNIQEVLNYLTDDFYNYLVHTNNEEEIVYDNSHTKMKDDDGLDVINLQYALDKMYDMIPQNCVDLPYDPSISELESTSVQNALDEIYKALIEFEEALTAAQVKYDNTDNVYIVGDNVQDALDEIEEKLDLIEKNGINKYLVSFIYDNSETKIQADEDDPTIHDELNAQEVLAYVIKKFTVIKSHLDYAVACNFDNTKTQIGTGTDVQTVIEQLDAQIVKNKNNIENMSATDVSYTDDQEIGATNVQNAISKVANRVKAVEDASGIKYDDSVSKMNPTAANVQKAIEKLDERIDTIVGWTEGIKSEDIPYDNTNVKAKLDSISTTLTDLSDAKNIKYTPNTTITSENVQGAIDTLAATKKNVDQIDIDVVKELSVNDQGDLLFGDKILGATDSSFHKRADEITYDDTYSQLQADNVQSAIDKLNTKVKTNIDDISEINDKFEDLSASNITYDNDQSIKTKIDSISNRPIAVADGKSITSKDAGTQNPTRTFSVNISQKQTVIESKKVTVDGGRIKYTIYMPNSKFDPEKTYYLQLSFDREKKDYYKIVYTVITSDGKSLGSSNFNETTNIKINPLCLYYTIEVTYKATQSSTYWSYLSGYDISYKIYSGEKVENVLKLGNDGLYVNKYDLLGTSSTPGILQPDGTTIIVDSNGVISSVGGGSGSGDGGSSGPSNASTTVYTDNKGLGTSSVQGAIDKLYDLINNQSADKVSYDDINGVLGGVADVQAALQALISYVSNNGGSGSGGGTGDSGDSGGSSGGGIIPTNINASNVPYDDLNTELGATKVQGAIEKLKEYIDTVNDSLVDSAGDISYENSDLESDNVEEALDKLSSLIADLTDMVDLLGAVDISFSASDNSDINATNVRDAIEEVDAKISNIAANKNTARDISYNNTDSGLESTTVQAALDELTQSIAAVGGDVGSLNGTSITYNNTASGLTSTNVQSAIDEVVSDIGDIDDRLNDLSAGDVKYSNTTSGLTSTNIQAAIDELSNLSAEDIDFTAGTGDTDIKSTNVQDAVEELNDKINNVEGNKNTAGDIIYNNADSGLTAANAQSAIDELTENINTVDGKIDDLGADDISFDSSNVVADIQATNVQTAIEELNTKTNNLPANKITVTAGTGELSIKNTNVQSALEELNNKVNSVPANRVTFTAGNDDGDLTSANVQAALEELNTKTNDLTASDIDFVPGEKEMDLKSEDIQAAMEELNEKVNNIEENKNTAVDISYSGNTSGLDAATVQEAIDNIYGSIEKSAEDIEFNSDGTSFADEECDNVQQVINALITRTDPLLSGMAGISYDNTTSQLKAENGQVAIDELDDIIDKIIAGTDKKYMIKYDDTLASFEASTISEAISEIDNKYQHYRFPEADEVKYDDTASNISRVFTDGTKVKEAQTAIEALASTIFTMKSESYDNAKDIKYENSEYPKYDRVAKALNVLFEKVVYEAPNFNTFTAGGYTPDEDGNVYLLKGTVLNGITFSWTLNKEVKTLQFNSGSLTTLSPTDTSTTYTPKLYTNKTFKIIATDYSGKSVTKTINFKFVDKIYYGSRSTVTNYSYSFATGLSSSFYNVDNTFSFILNVSGTSNYGFIAMPFKVNSLMMNGFDTTMEYCGEFSQEVENESGVTLTLHLYRTCRPGIGELKIVKEK